MANPATAETEPVARPKPQLLRRVSIAEASSFLILLVATLVKRTGGTESGVQVVGPIHGILFVVYALLIIRDHRLLDWTVWRVLGAIILGSVPLGGFWVERRWLSES